MRDSSHTRRRSAIRDAEEIAAVAVVTVAIWLGLLSFGAAAVRP